MFLISAGMSLDIRIVGARPLLVCGAAAGMVLLKLMVVAPLSRAFGLSWTNGLHIGLLLGPGGEFAFVIVSPAMAERLLTPDAAPVGPVIASIHEKRASLQATIKAMAPGAEVRPLGRRRLCDRS